MTKKSTKMTKEEARNLARRHGISLQANFFTLRSSEVSYLLELADKVKYRKPVNANGSRGRYFFAYLQRGK